MQVAASSSRRQPGILASTGGGGWGGAEQGEGFAAQAGGLGAQVGDVGFAGDGGVDQLAGVGAAAGVVEPGGDGRGDGIGIGWAVGRIGVGGVAAEAGEFAVGGGVAFGRVEQAAEQDAEGIDVGTGVDRGAVELLGGHVTGASGGGGRRAGGAGDAPVEDDDLAEVAEADVGGFEVAVHDAFAVHIGHRLADAEEDVDEAAAAPALVAAGDRGEQVAEVAAFDDAHREPAAAVVEVADLVDRDDAGVLQAGGDERLLHRAVAVLAADDLDGDFALQVAVVGSTHGAHAAGGNEAAVVEATVERDGFGGAGQAGAGRVVSGPNGGAGGGGVRSCGLPGRGGVVQRRGDCVAVFHGQRVCLIGGVVAMGAGMF